MTAVAVVAVAAVAFGARVAMIVGLAGFAALATIVVGLAGFAALATIVVGLTGFAALATIVVGLTGFAALATIVVGLTGFAAPAVVVIARAALAVTIAAIGTAVAAMFVFAARFRFMLFAEVALRLRPAFEARRAIGVGRAGDGCLRLSGPVVRGPAGATGEEANGKNSEDRESGNHRCLHSSGTIAPEFRPAADAR